MLWFSRLGCLLHATHVNAHAFCLMRGAHALCAAVVLEFKHNVCGREVYAEGTVDACLFLHQKIKEGAEKKLYNMIDVLSAGAMR